ncbi:hypothetical protein RCL1_007153 [Eukaryota sp. TZLM3-RCL]
MFDVNKLDFNPSKLGTSEYWSSFYLKESSYLDEHSDFAEIWYPETVSQIEHLISELPLSKDAPVLDIGVGNGAFLLTLHELGFFNITGTDYVQESVDLASKVITQNNLTAILLRDDFTQSALPSDEFSLAHDKGTLDAILLAGEPGFVKSYIITLTRILKREGFFVVTSGNLTREELIEMFSESFTLYSEANYRSFSFGGNSGTTHRTICFQKR